MIQGDGWFDIPRSQALWNDVFGGPAAIDQGGAVDRPAVGEHAGDVRLRRQ